MAKKRKKRKKKLEKPVECPQCGCDDRIEWHLQKDENVAFWKCQECKKIWETHVLTRGSKKEPGS